MEQLLQEMLQKNYGKSISDASNEEIYTALLCITKEKMAGMKRNEGNKKLYYIFTSICYFFLSLYSIRSIG